MFKLVRISDMFSSVLSQRLQSVRKSDMFSSVLSQSAEVVC